MCNRVANLVPLLELGIGTALVHAMLYVVVVARRMVHVWLAQLGS